MGNDFAKALLLICLKKSCKVRISPRQRSPDARSRAVPSFLHALSDVKFSLDRIVIRSLFGPWRLEGREGVGPKQNCPRGPPSKQVESLVGSWSNCSDKACCGLKGTPWFVSSWKHINGNPELTLELLLIETRLLILKRFLAWYGRGINQRGNFFHSFGFIVNSTFIFSLFYPYLPLCHLLLSKYMGPNKSKIFISLWIVSKPRLMAAASIGSNFRKMAIILNTLRSYQEKLW